MKAFVSPEERKLKSEKILSSKNITVNKEIGIYFSSKEATLKSKEDICKRIKISLGMIMILISINTDKYAERLEAVLKMIKYFDAENLLEKDEKRLLTGEITDEVIESISLNYEKMYALGWVLGLVDDSCMLNPNDFAPGEELFKLGENFRAKTLEDMLNAYEMRDIEDALDMTDFYVRLNVTILTNKGELDLRKLNAWNLNSDVIASRREILEWLFDIDFSKL